MTTNQNDHMLIETTSPALQLLREQAAATRLQISARTLGDWRREGCGPSHIVLPGGLIRYSEEDLVAFQRARRVQGVAA